MENESTKMEENVQPNNPVPESPVQAAPAQPVKKKGPWGAILIGLLILVLLGGIAGLAYKGYTLNNELTNAQTRLADLQGKHDKLQKDNQALTEQIAQVKADTETAQADTKTAQQTLTDAQNKAKLVKTNTDKASLYAIILNSIFVEQDNDLVIAVEVALTGDKNLQTLYETILKNPSAENFDNFIQHVFKSISTNLTK